MPRQTFLVFSLLLFSSPAFGQTTPTDSQTLQALLTEIRQLRQDLQTAAMGARRAQILIHRLYVQEAIVARTSQSLDEAKSELAQFEARKKWETIQIKNYEDRRDRAQNSAERKQFDDAISSLKSQMETRATEEQEAQAKQAELEGQLRIEQAKLDQLQDELDRLDKSVMSAGTPQDPGQKSSAKLQ